MNQYVIPTMDVLVLDDEVLSVSLPGDFSDSVNLGGGSGDDGWLEMD